MDWPQQRVEDVPPEAFRPPFCSRASCPTNNGGAAARFKGHGWFRRRSEPRRVRRFLCLICGKTCSQATFGCTYYLKRRKLLEPVARGLVAGSAHRQLARSLDCAPSTVTRLSARLGRHALLLQARALERIGALNESVAYDHHEVAVFSQNHPVGIGTAVGRRSWFVYGIDQAPHRRGGRSARKKTPGAEHRQSGSVLRACRCTVDLLLGLSGPADRLRLVTDGHPAYAAVMARHPERRRIEHRTFPNPPRGPKGSEPPPLARRRDRAMFAVDLLHKLFRHSQAHHKRETIAMARRRNALMERAFLLVAWRNFVKGRSERKPDRTTPAMRIGLTARPWPWPRVLARRLFAWRTRVPDSWMPIYRRELITSAIGPNRLHTLANAF